MKQTVVRPPSCYSSSVLPLAWLIVLLLTAFVLHACSHQGAR